MWCTSQEHDQAVDADAQAPGGGHAVLQGPEEVLVHDHGVLVARGLGPGLGLQDPALELGVGELAEGVAQLEAGHDGLEALDQPGLAAVGPGEGRDLLGVVADEDRPPELALGRLLVDLEHELARAPSLVERHTVLVGDASQRVDGHSHVDVRTRLLLDQVGHRRPPPRRGEIEAPALEADLRRSEQLL